MTNLKLNHVYPRGKKFYFRIAVPKHLRKGSQTHIWHSLKTEDADEAAIRAVPYRRHYKKLFSAPEGTRITASLTHSELVAESKTYGLTYRDHKEVLSAPVADSIEMLSDIFAVTKMKKTLDDTELQMVGGVVVPGLSLDEMFARYQDMSSGKFSDLDARAKQKKWNRYAEPIADFKRAMGDIDVFRITPKIANDYAISLGKRIDSGELKSETAKKKLLFLSAVVRKVLTDYPGRENPFEKAEVEYNGDDKTSRRPFTETEILALRKKLETSTANDELKAILQIAEYTGAHAKEICLLTASDIHIIEDGISFIRIGANANRKTLKTGGARYRDIPLVPGPALEAAKRFRSGFPRYARFNGSEAFSASANKIIQQVADGATTYSFRHRLVDLLRNSKCQEGLLKEIIGHNGGITADYGDGTELEVKLEALQNAMVKAEQKQKQIKQD